MKPGILERLCCPACTGRLSLVTSTPANQVEKGSLRCTQCSQQYPVVRGVPRFVPTEGYASSFGLQWKRFSKTQLDSYTETNVSRDRWLRQTAWRPEWLRGATVLDIGCGAGRFAEVALSYGAIVFAVDYSEAVDACQENLGQHHNLHVIQADMHRLPFPPATFDFVYCFGVLQHTPRPRLALAALPPQLKPGARLAVDIYPRRWTNVFLPKYWLRPLTTRLPKLLLFRAVEVASPALLLLSRALARVPLLGWFLRRLVPVANYERVYPLDEVQLQEWAVLDTFDMLSPAYDRPGTPRELLHWLREAELIEIEVIDMGHLVGRGRRSDSYQPPGN